MYAYVSSSPKLGCNFDYWNVVDAQWVKKERKKTEGDTE